MMYFNQSNKLVILGLGLIGMMASAAVSAGDIYVIAHPGVTLTQSELKKVYLGEQEFAGSVKLVPVDNAAVQGDFLSKVINIEAAAYASLWLKKGFRSGLAAPLVKFGDAEVINFVRRTPGAIGYVGGRAADGVALLYKY